MNCWLAGAGWPPTWPAGFTVFCAWMALTTSATVMPSFASWSGLSQTRMAYCPAPKTCVWPIPGKREIGSFKLM